MDINFHYYAVKTLAVLAGFQEGKAQMIANFSQFVDDFTIYSKLRLSDVPDFAKHLAKKDKTGWIFYPVTTGFDNWFEMVRLTKTKNQKYITVPFHFIPPHCKLNEDKKGDDRIAWRVVPAQMNTESLIQGLLRNARERYKAAPDSPENLIRIGLLLHIFADTYAHQNFSGFWGWENYCYLTKCYDISKGKDVTDQYSPSFFHQMFAIGHAEANHAPDDSNLLFEITMQLRENGSYDFVYSRSNISEFCKASKEIIDYLRSCLGFGPIPDDAWGRLSLQLGQGFLTDAKNPVLLNRHWKGIFPGINYYYNKEDMMRSMLQKLPEPNGPSDDVCALVERLSSQGIELDTALYETKSNAFFLYNVIANEVRNFVNDKDVALEQLSALENALNQQL